jgi:hypothetical protein
VFELLSRHILLGSLWPFVPRSAISCVHWYAYQIDPIVPNLSEITIVQGFQIREERGLLQDLLVPCRPIWKAKQNVVPHTPVFDVSMLRSICHRVVDPSLLGVAAKCVDIQGAGFL